MEIIKPCPHCGGDAYIDHNYNEKTDCYFFKVKCEVCGATGKTTSIKRTDLHEAENITNIRAYRWAIVAWNMRTSEEETK